MVSCSVRENKFAYFAMFRNSTLTMMSTPVIDLAAAARVNQEKTDASWAKVW